MIFRVPQFYSQSGMPNYSMNWHLYLPWNSLEKNILTCSCRLSIGWQIGYILQVLNRGISWLDYELRRRLLVAGRLVDDDRLLAGIACRQSSRLSCHINWHLLILVICSWHLLYDTDRGRLVLICRDTQVVAGNENVVVQGSLNVLLRRRKLRVERYWMLNGCWHLGPIQQNFHCRNWQCHKLRGKYHCTADLLFDWLVFDQTCKAVANSTRPGLILGLWPDFRQR